MLFRKKKINEYKDVSQMRTVVLFFWSFSVVIVLAIILFGMWMGE